MRPNKATSLALWSRCGVTPQATVDSIRSGRHLHLALELLSQRSSNRTPHCRYQAAGTYKYSRGIDPLRRLRLAGEEDELGGQSHRRTSFLSSSVNRRPVKANAVFCLSLYRLQVAVLRLCKVSNKHVFTAAAKCLHGNQEA